MDSNSWLNVAFAAIAVFGAALSGFALVAVRRNPSPRLGLVAGGFLLITVQGLVIGIGLFTGGISIANLLLLCAAFEAGLLAVLFAATLVR